MILLFRTRHTIALVAVVLTLWGCSKAGTESSANGEASIQPVILDANEFRQEITDLDRLIFEEQSLGKERRALLVTKLEEFSVHVKGTSDSRFLAMEASEIKGLADGTRRMPEEAVRRQLPNQWMRIRSNLFEDQSWFARSAADLPPASGATQ